MTIISQPIIGAAVCAGVIAVVWSAKGLLLTPVRPQKGAVTYAVIRIHGNAEGLEQVINGILWLRDSGKAEMPVIIAAEDVTPEAMKRAKALAVRCEGIVCAPPDIDKLTKEQEWTEPDLQQ